MKERDRQSSPTSGRLIAVALATSGLAAGYAMAMIAGGDRGVMTLVAWSLAALAAMLWSVVFVSALRRMAEADRPAPRAAVVAPAPAPALEPAPPAAPRDAFVPAADDVIDESVIESLRTLGGDAFVAEVVSQFISEGVLCLLKIAQAIGEGDMDEYAAQIHALRSSAANVGARRLYKLCLEGRAIRAEELEASGSDRFVLLQKEFAAAEAVLKGRKSGPGAMAGNGRAV